MATQKGRNWSSGDIVTAANLSSIERGVSAVAEEYTPTTWANGDTVTATGLNNIEQGIANAEGGGSSDFSTATVTVNASEFGVDIIPVFIFGDAIVSDASIIGNTYTVPLYKNECRWLVMNLYTVGVLGNATYDAENGVIIITGDCTITIFDEPSGDDPIL